jgi:hypothetical protein
MTEAIRGTTVPLQTGSKIPAVRWRDLAPGESQPDRAGTQGRALLTGSRSSGTIVLDVDVKDGGFQRLEQLESALGHLPETRTVRTPSGGLHLYFQTDTRLRSVARVNVPGVPIVKGVDGVDLRAEGGIVVLPGCPRGYVVEEDHPIAGLPPAWLTALPKARAAPSPGQPVTIETVKVDDSTLRQRLVDTARARRGDGWGAIRRAAEGSRMFSIQGGPPGALLVHGVDEFISKSIVYTLASAEIDGFAWYQVAPDDAARLFAPSLSILRQDVQSIGGESKFTAEHFAEKWSRACEKIAQDVQETFALALDRAETRQEAEQKAEAGTPLIVQIDSVFFVLDDRSRLSYEGPIQPANVSGICAKVWGSDRPLVCEDEKGKVKPMTPQQIREAYGTSCMRLETEYTATVPRVDDLNLVNCLPNPPVEAIHSPEVEAWLSLLGGPRLLDWIAWAAPEKCGATIPALAMIGGSHVGKTLLAESLARAAGQPKAGDLKAILGRFRYLLSYGPIVFGDEGLPSIEGKPATEEFRALVTSPEHLIELKGLDKRMTVRGGVRCIMAANRADRLFSNTGTMNVHDVQALTRRLFVIDVEGEEKIDRLVSMSNALGRYEGDPARSMKVAQHLRWVQLNHTCPPPEPCAGSIDAKLRTGSDGAKQAIEAIEDAITPEGIAVDWLARDAAALYVQVDPLARRIEAKSPGHVLRALGPYVVRTDRTKVHPVTGASTEKRTRWTVLDLTKLRKDGIDV